MSKEVEKEKTMHITLFLEEHGSEYEAELCTVLKKKFGSLVLTKQDWEKTIKDFLEKKVN
ncbi:hypothetical protein [Treponema putidum]|uniref:Uncharacterized protein n=1 Tax=Treponema putidum TaxID=221027 RepID=A0ABY5HUE1_9SPIR|nr:hypothetical protein [Treponema putidum]UTY27647.1 hypothetical protein E4N76_00590 [Treponema putidum]